MAEKYNKYAEYTKTAAEITEKMIAAKGALDASAILKNANPLYAKQVNAINSSKTLEQAIAETAFKTGETKAVLAAAEANAKILGAAGKAIGKAALPVTVGLIGYNTYEEYEKTGGNKTKAAGTLVAETASAVTMGAMVSGGAAAGMAIAGIPSAGIGAIPGALVGGAIGFVSYLVSSWFVGDTTYNAVKSTTEAVITSTSSSTSLAAQSTKNLNQTSLASNASGIIARPR